MAENEDFGGDQLAAVTTGTSFSQLLFADDHYEVDRSHGLNYSPFIPPKNKMLCFGNEHKMMVFPEASGTPHRSAVSCSHSSSASSGSLKFSLTKSTTENGLDQEADAIGEASALSNRPLKKIRANTPSLARHAKRKEKLGERITALQQLVSPFGKSDTASVLHEAMGYIKFLQEQVQVLCSPYLQHRPPSLSAIGERENGEDLPVDLRSRGLCLIPVDCSLHLADYTVADFWSPAAGKML